MRFMILLVFAAVLTNTKARICQIICDEMKSNLIHDSRKIFTETLFSRPISIYVSDSLNAGFASISNGDPNDEIWVDRTFDGGVTWESRIGNRAIPNGARTVSTPAFNIDGDITARQIGALRACGKAGNRDNVVCTPWTRSKIKSSSPSRKAATALMFKYNSKGQWDTTGWWNAANCLTALIDYMIATGDESYKFIIDNTFEKNKNEFAGTFRNDFVDDSGWWGLAWIRAYDLTKDSKYLEAAKVICDYMFSFKDDRCGGGVYWSVAKGYKNAITNELFIKLSAALHNRIKGDTLYLNRAMEVYNWFEGSGMINGENLINDGLDTMGTCRNNGGLTWTYNQGVILGALVQLHKGTKENKYLDRAKQIAGAVVKSNYLNNNGILHEPCDHSRSDCGADGPSFKGIFARNLGELNSALSDHPYTEYIKNNADSIIKHGDSIYQYGLHYEGPFEFYSAASQQSALEMIVAAGKTYI